MPLRKPTKTPSPPLTPPKDDKWVKRKLGVKDSKPTHNVRDHSGGSTSTGTTVIGFTPPHEKSHPRPKGEKLPRHSSSEVTEIGVTPPHELYTSPPRSAPPAPKSPKKKSLPWLQNPNKPIEEPIFVTGPSQALTERSMTREKAEQKADRKYH
jgi:hypothetical protein